MTEEIINEAEEKMKKAIEVLKSEFMTIRTGRASASLLDRVMVDYYGTPTSLRQLASVSVPEARLIIINPYDRNILGDIEKAILKSDLGLTPTNDGHIIRLSIPPLTGERRQELVKIIKNLAEESRIAIRNIRRDANEHIRQREKNKEISEDERHRRQEKLQKITDSSIEEIDHLMANKEKEIMEVI